MTIAVCLFLQVPVRADSGPTRVRLKPLATCNGSVVMLSDIAEISQVTIPQRRQLESLDITDFPADQNSLRIDASLVRFRLELATPPIVGFELTGAPRITVQRPVPAAHDEHVLQAVQQALADAWGVDPSNVRVKLLQPLEPTLLAGVRNPADLDVALLPHPRPGNNRAKLLVHDQGRLTRTAEILVASQLFAEQVIAAHDLDRGQTLESHMLTTHWEAVTSPEHVVAPADLIGKQLNVAVRGGQPVQLRHLARKQPQSAQPVVKPRDRVRVIVRKGSLAVTLADAEILQAGAVGDHVRVRNPQTNKVITARVLSADECTVRL